jgi:cephalosporin hydroxylase
MKPIDFAPLYQRVVDGLPDPAHVVEVGCFWGRSAIHLATMVRASGKAVQIDCIDIWDDPRFPRQLEERHGVAGAKERFLTNLQRAGVLEMIRPITADSTKAAQRYKNRSLDFVFIDAAHDTPKVTADVRAWLPKVKPGGVLAGHDWGRFGVTAGVLAVLPEADVAPAEGATWVYHVPGA